MQITVSARKLRHTGFLQPPKFVHGLQTLCLRLDKRLTRVKVWMTAHLSEYVVCAAYLAKCT